jgi:hypothetical protein
MNKIDWKLIDEGAHAVPRDVPLLLAASHVSTNVGSELHHMWFGTIPSKSLWPIIATHWSEMPLMPDEG